MSWKFQTVLIVISKSDLQSTVRLQQTKGPDPSETIMHCCIEGGWGGVCARIHPLSLQTGIWYNLSFFIYIYIHTQQQPAAATSDQWYSTLCCHCSSRTCCDLTVFTMISCLEWRTPLISCLDSTPRPEWATNDAQRQVVSRTVTQCRQTAKVFLL